MKLSKRWFLIIAMALQLMMFSASTSLAQSDYPLSISSMFADATVELNGFPVYKRTSRVAGVSLNALPYLVDGTNKITYSL